MRAGPQCVLVIDDNVELAGNIAEFLEMNGHVTYVAASAEEGLPTNPSTSSARRRWRSSVSPISSRAPWIRRSSAARRISKIRGGR